MGNSFCTRLIEALEDSLYPVCGKWLSKRVHQIAGITHVEEASCNLFGSVSLYQRVLRRSTRTDRHYYSEKKKKQSRYFDQVRYF